MRNFLQRISSRSFLWSFQRTWLWRFCNQCSKRAPKYQLLRGVDSCWLRDFQRLRCLQSKLHYLAWQAMSSLNQSWQRLGCWNLPNIFEHFPTWRRWRPKVVRLARSGLESNNTNRKCDSSAEQRCWIFFGPCIWINEKNYPTTI